MSVLYRAIWNDDRPQLIDGVLADFGAWVKEKSSGSVAVPDQGVVAGTAPLSRSSSATYEVEVRAERATGDQSVIGVSRASYVELRPDGSRWTTTLRVWRARQPEDEERQEGAGWVWVDVEAVSDDSLDDITIAAPRLVPALLRNGVDPHRRCVPLTANPQMYAGSVGAERLANLLGHTDRDMPIVVFSAHDPVGGPGTPTWPDIVDRAAKSLAGMASVGILDVVAGEALGSILGRSYEVRPGAMRIYLPNLDPATNRDDWRHREILRPRFQRRVATAADLLTRTLGPRAASRRAPRSYDTARSLLEAGPRIGDDLARRLDIAENEGRQQRERNAEADDRYVDLLTEFEVVQIGAAELREDVHRISGERDRLLALVRRSGLEEHFWTEGTEVGVQSVPSRASSPWDAAALAQEHLSDHLALPDEACVDLEILDAAVESSAWGQTAWEGFRALHAYAEQMASGAIGTSFWTWCESSQHPLAWRATQKKLAMTESESLKNTRRLWAKRLVPVSTEVDPTGKIHMEAHLKIAEGGGPLAPRIYFLHSPVTKKVHVGFFGPHKHMPNSLA